MFGQSNPGEKSSGMEMMMRSLLKAMGVTPDALTGYIENGKQLATQFVTAMQQMNARLANIEVELKLQRTLLETLHATHVSKAAAETEIPEWPMKSLNP